jgi:endonuclease/exonuclease/phosphatase family metal-dependent hydrolase
VDAGRLERMAGLIGQLGADIVALQEVALASVEGAVLDQPALFGELTGLDHRYGAVWHYPLVEPATGRTFGAALWGNAILSRHPITRTVTHALPVAMDDDPGDRQDVEPRCALAVEIELPTGPATFISTHLAWLGGRARRLQADALAAMVAATSGPLVLAGDLNAPIEAAELEPLAALTDGFAAVGVPAGDQRRRSCGLDRIDHVLTRGFDVVACRVATEAGDASDHLPVVARLRLSAEGGSSGSQPGPAAS